MRCERVRERAVHRPSNCRSDWGQTWMAHILINGAELTAAVTVSRRIVCSLRTALPPALLVEPQLRRTAARGCRAWNRNKMKLKRSIPCMSLLQAPLKV